MAKMTRTPFSPIKPLPTAKPPTPSKTQDTTTHNTSPNKGPQPQAPITDTVSSAPKAKIKVMPDVPMHKVKHGPND